MSSFDQNVKRTTCTIKVHVIGFVEIEACNWLGKKFVLSFSVSPPHVGNRAEKGSTDSCLTIMMFISQVHYEEEGLELLKQDNQWQRVSRVTNIY